MTEIWVRTTQKIHDNATEHGWRQRWENPWLLWLYRGDYALKLSFGPSRSLSGVCEYQVTANGSQTIVILNHRSLGKRDWVIRRLRKKD